MIVPTKPQQKTKSTSTQDLENNRNKKCVWIRRFSLVAWSIIHKSFLDSTIHGSKRIFKNNSLFLRIMWICFFLASSTLCTYVIALTLIDYFEFDTVSKTERVHMITTEFPAVTICNTNPFLTNESEKYIDELLKENQIPDINDDEFENNSIDGPISRFYRLFLGMNALDPNRTDAFRRSLGQDISDMLFSCTYNLRRCSAEDFSWYFDIYYGNCFTFNSGKVNIIEHYKRLCLYFLGNILKTKLKYRNLLYTMTMVNLHRQGSCRCGSLIGSHIKFLSLTFRFT